MNKYLEKIAATYDQTKWATKSNQQAVDPRTLPEENGRSNLQGYAVSAAVGGVSSGSIAAHKSRTSPKLMNLLRMAERKNPNRFIKVHALPTTGYMSSEAANNFLDNKDPRKLNPMNKGNREGALNDLIHNDRIRNSRISPRGHYEKRLREIREFKEELFDAGREIANVHGTSSFKSIRDRLKARGEFPDRKITEPALLKRKGDAIALIKTYLPRIRKAQSKNSYLRNKVEKITPLFEKYKKGLVLREMGSAFGKAAPAGALIGGLIYAGYKAFNHEKQAELFSPQTKDDLKNTAGIMGLGTVMAGAGGLVNKGLGLEAGAARGILSKLSPKAKFLTAAGTMGALGGVGDFAALKAHRALSNGKD